MSRVTIPRAPELDHHPELASLAILDAALLAAEHALVSAQPHLRAAEPSRELGPPTDGYWIATVLLNLARQLHQAIVAYRSLYRDDDVPFEDDIPF